VCHKQIILLFEARVIRRLSELCISKLQTSSKTATSLWWI